MTTPPAAWYDDPADPTHNRYWDGANWTEHRAPKDPAEPAEAPAEGSVWNIFPDTFNTVGTTWRQLLVVAVPNVVMTVVGLIVASATVDAVFDGELAEMVDRLNDGSRSAADDAYFEALEASSPGAIAWLAIVVGLLCVIVGSVAATATQRTFAASMLGRPIEPAEAFRGAAARFWRVALWSILLTVALLVWCMALLAFPIPTLATLPVLLLLGPYVLGTYAALAIAPVGTNPVAQARQMVKGRWRRSMLRCLVFALLWFVLTFSALLASQFFAADLRVALGAAAISWLVQMTILWGGLVSYWIGSGGPLDPQLRTGYDA